MPFLSLVTLTFNLDLQTAQSEGPYNVFLVNLAQISPALPAMFHIKQKSADWRRGKYIQRLYSTALRNGHTKGLTKSYSGRTLAETFSFKLTFKETELSVSYTMKMRWQAVRGDRAGKTEATLAIKRRSGARFNV